MTEENNSDVKLALDEMRLSMEKIYNASDILDQKANTLLTTAGLILAIATTLQISISPNRSVYFWGLLIIVIVSFIVSIVFILRSSMPLTYHLPIIAEWQELDQQLFDKSERDAILVLISGYIDQISHNESLNKSKAHYYKISFWILIFTIIALLILARIP